MQLKTISLTRRILYKSTDILICAAAFAVCGLIFLTLFGRYSFLELTVHFRFQYAIGSFVCLILLAVFRRWKLCLLMLVCGVFNFAQIVPYYFAAPHRIETANSQKLRLMTANVAMKNENYAAFHESVRISAPDVLVLQEVTEKWNREIKSLRSAYSYFEIVPKQGGAGLAIFSRYPLESTKLLFAESSMHPALLAVINFNGTRLTVLLMHPLTPMRPDKFANRNEQFQQAAELIKSTPEPKLLVGDLNTTMWSPYYSDLVDNSGLYDSRIGRGLYPTFESHLPLIFGIPIDHLLTGETIQIENLAFGVPTGSDHRPLVIDLKVVNRLEAKTE